MNELLSLSAVELVRRIHNREISPVKVVDTHIARIEAVNPALIALVTPMFDQAHDEARRAAKRLAHTHDDLPTLSGLPVTIMVIFSLFGSPARPAGFGQLVRIGELRNRVLDLMGGSGLMLWPVHHSTALRHGFAWGPHGLPIYTVGINAFGFPSVALPVYWSDEGLPAGVQVIGLPGEDEVALAAAAALEKAFGGWRLAAL